MNSDSNPKTHSGTKTALPRLLIVDDDSDMLLMLRTVITKKCRCEIEVADSGDKAWSLLDNWRPDVILTDIKMPGLDGLTLLNHVKQKDPTVSVIVMTGHGTIEIAVRALREGAYDFFEKPFDNDHLLHALQRSLERTDLLRENRTLQEKLAGKAAHVGFIGTSPKLTRVFDLIDRVADTDVSVLIRGESGTGKEVAAQALHSLSSRKAKPLVAVNCPALPEHILESELFGYAKGSFTGATRDKKGLFFEADGSTILLDEIGDLPINLQTKLLRVLQEREIMPLGHTKPIKVDVRVLASTNQDLEAKIRQGLFREDLLYRLNVVTITMPSLKEIPEDIPLLAEHFLHSFQKEYNRPDLTFTPAALQHLMTQTWKGNVRELQNVVKRAVLLASGSQISECDFVNPSHAAEAVKSPCPDFGSLTYNQAKEESMTLFSQKYLTRALENAVGNISVAARQAGIGRQSFQRLLKRYSIDASTFRTGSANNS
ncbi:MAG: sigma-54 dependent transcriptional regulator [Proteobacteria bacterium]|nr:sigma-54 dependent transcriptional regulator [Pseudomonadota bacterium]MBU1639580.1 sigma-54 dependent transcriptional regulator [Pseudomonadota bacterium]